MDGPKVKIEDTAMQSFLRDEISSYTRSSYVYYDRLQLLSDKDRFGYLNPIMMAEEEALKELLTAYKKIITTFQNQIDGLTPYYDCNLSYLTNSPVEVPQESIKVTDEIVQEMIDQKGGGHGFLRCLSRLGKNKRSLHQIDAYTKTSFTQRNLLSS